MIVCQQNHRAPSATDNLPYKPEYRPDWNMGQPQNLRVLIQIEHSQSRL